jgi:chromosome segregation ATPase
MAEKNEEIEKLRTSKRGLERENSRLVTENKNFLMMVSDLNKKVKDHRENFIILESEHNSVLETQSNMNEELEYYRATGVEMSGGQNNDSGGALEKDDEYAISVRSHIEFYK